MILKRIGVIGAGVMGVGVAQTLAQSQHEVVLVDINDDILEQAKGQIYQKYPSWTFVQCCARI